MRKQYFFSYIVNNILITLVILLLLSPLAQLQGQVKSFAGDGVKSAAFI